MRRQDIENDVSVRREWAVVESEHDLMVVERQRLLVLHAANVADFVGANGKHAARGLARQDCRGIAWQRPERWHQRLLGSKEQS